MRVLHLGDTMFHGYWWRMVQRHGPFDVVLVPVNGAVVGFPHRVPASPLPVAMDPAQAAIAAGILGARLAIPIHAEGYEVDGVYQPVADAAGRFAAAAAAERDVPVRILAAGESIEVSAADGDLKRRSDESCALRGSYGHEPTRSRPGAVRRADRHLDHRGDPPGG